MNIAQRAPKARAKSTESVIVAAVPLVLKYFNFVISQNAKWGHAGFYIDCHRMTVPENILLQKKH